MDWSRRVVVHLLLISIWAVSLLAAVYPATAQAQGGGGNIHIVEAGETLRDVARQAGTDVATLIAINDLSNGDVIYVGQQLTLPGGAPTNGGWQQPSQQGDNYSAGATWGQQPAQGDSNPAGYNGGPSYAGQGNQRQGMAYDPSSTQQNGDNGGPRGPYGPDPNWGDSNGNAQQTQGYSYAPDQSGTQYSAQEGSNQQNSDWGWVNSADNSYTAGASWDPSSTGQGNQGQGNAYDPSASQQPSDSDGPRGPYGRDPNWGDSNGNSSQPGNSYAAGNGGAQQPTQDGPNQQNSDWGWVNSDNNSHSQGTSWAPAQSAPKQGAVALTGEKWIDIDIGDQTLVAYQGDTPVRSFIISTGSARYPTVTGTFYTYARFAVQDMWGGSVADGDYYYQPAVPWVQYFYEGFSIHGAYWHNMFGTPIGHGCINMRVEEAQWLFNWTSVTGIRVVVHQ